MEEMIKKETNIYAKRFYKNVMKRGYKLNVGSVYVKAKENVPMRCPKNHSIKMSPYVFNKGHNCAICARRKVAEVEIAKYKRKFINQLTLDGYSLIGNDYKNSQTLTTIKHEKCGYVYKVIPASYIGNGIRCGRCAGNIKRSQEYIEKKVKSISGGEYEVLGNYVNTDTPVKVRHNSESCNYHEWKIAMKSFIKAGARCPKCAIKRGPDHPSYRVDITDEERERGRFMDRSKLNKWRVDVFERDSYTCQSCYVRGGVVLHAHHLNGYHWDKENRFNIDNGVTLCYDCHMDFHKAYGRNNNTKEQFEEYVEKNNTYPSGLCK